MRLADSGYKLIETTEKQDMQIVIDSTLFAMKPTVFRVYTPESY